MPQATLTIVTALASRAGGDIALEARAALTAIAGAPSQSRFAFDQVPGLHFARVALVEDPDVTRAPGERLPPVLVFSLVYDVGATSVLDQLLRVARPQVDTIYAFCDGYPGPAAADADVREYLLRHDCDPLLFYQGAEGVTVEAVRASGKLRQRLGQRLDELVRAGADAETATSLARHLRAAASAGAAAGDGAPLRRLSDRALRWRQLLWLGIVFGPVVVLLVAFVLACIFAPIAWAVALALPVAALVLLMGALLLHERADAGPEDDPAADPNDDHLQQVRNEEDHVVQNALTHCAIVKQGRLRSWLLRWVFWVIGRRVSLIDRYQGSLGGIASIHFARWILLDRDRDVGQRRRLLFLSDYDGSWESYLGEFVDRAAGGLTAVWSNTERFPRTWLLALFGGARHEQLFKEWTRRRQVETPIRYTAYADCTLDNLENDLRMTDLVARGQGPADDRELLSLF